MARDKNADMAHIHYLKEWPLFHWNTDSVAPALARLCYVQGLFAGRCLALGEGVRKEAAQLVLARDAPENARGVFDDVQENREKLLTASRILYWRKLAGGEPAWRGDAAGGAPEASRIPAELKIFLAWFNFESMPGGAAAPVLWQNPVLKAGTAYLWFMGIRPFSEGSEALALAVCNLALLRADPGKPYYSLGERLAQEREACRAALDSALRGNMDITAWLLWFMGALERAVQNAESLIAPAVKRAPAFDCLRSASLNRRQKKILGALLEDGERTISSGAYAKAASCSGDTALRDIQELMDLGLLRKDRAGGRSTSYSLKV